MAALVSRRDALRLRLESGPPLVTDGGMGGELRARGWQGPTEEANLHAPGTVEEIHRAFRQAGADLLLTNTFTAAARPPEEADAAITAATARARAAADGAFVVGSIGPVVAWSAESLAAIARMFDRADVDAIWFETHAMIGERREGGLPPGFLDEVKRGYPGPVLVSIVPRRETAHTLMWWIDHLVDERRARPASIGFNCGSGPAQTLACAKRAGVHHVPFSLRASAGLPEGEGRGLVYPVDAAAFGEFARAAAALGARIIGGCCGASPAHIAAVATAVRNLPNRLES